MRTWIREHCYLILVVDLDEEDDQWGIIKSSWEEVEDVVESLENAGFYTEVWGLDFENSQLIDPIDIQEATM